MNNMDSGRWFDTLANKVWKAFKCHLEWFGKVIHRFTVVIHRIYLTDIF